MSIRKIKLHFSIVLFMVCSIGTMNSQDLHFTNNTITPTFFNPAQTGAFAGTYRAGMIYRDQWRSIIDDPYQQAALFIDSPIVWGLTKQHWVGVGATLFYDKAGKPGQTWSAFYPGVSYHIAFDKKIKNVFTLGAQYGFSNRGYSTEGYVSEYTTLSGPDDPDLAKIKGQSATENFSAGYSDLNIGILFKSRLDKFSKFEIGASFMHVLNPSFNFGASPTGGSTGSNNIGNRINFHTKYRRASSKRMIWEPSAYYSQAPGASNIQIQLRNEYLLKKKGNIVLISGLGFRVGDSAQLLTGAKYKDWTFSLSYDYGVSALSSEGVATAYELGVYKIFVVNKKPEVKPIIYCPRL